MLRIFHDDDRINFVDDRNAFVGFDVFQSCCEDFGWAFSRGDGQEIDDESESTHYHFVRPLKDIDGQVDPVSGESDDAGGEAIFRLEHDGGGRPLYLHLWNHHNGYYAHALEAKSDGQMVVDEIL